MGFFVFKGDIGVDLKIFLLHKDSAILEGLELFFNMIDTDFGITVDISTFEPDEINNVYTMVTDDDLFEGYGIIIFNTFNVEYLDTIFALETCAPESIVFYEFALPRVPSERFHPITNDFLSDLQLILDEDYIQNIVKNTQKGRAISDDVRFESLLQILRLKDNPLQANNDEELPLDDNTVRGPSTGVDFNMKELLAAQVAGFHLNDLEDVVEVHDEDKSEYRTEEQPIKNNEANVIIKDITDNNETIKPINEEGIVEFIEPPLVEGIIIVNETVNGNDEETESNSDFSRESQIIEDIHTNQQNSLNKNEELSLDDESKVSSSFERTRLIQKQLFAKQHWEGHKSIGIWSPLPKMGVTTFTINYALFLAENRVYAGVLEGLKNEPMLKHWIKRYTPIPKKWVSYAKVVHSTGDDSNNADWTYRNVLYLPLDDDDGALHWSADKLAMYLNTPALMDVTLIDLPSGIMHEYTYHSLYYLSELWVLVDDTFQELVAWKHYIHAIQKKYDIKVKLIFNKQYEFSQVKRLASSLELDVICTLPSLHKEVMRNYYETQPLLFSEGVREQLFGPFVELTHYLMGKEFSIQTTIDNQMLIPTKEEDNYWTVFLEKIKRWL